ncbi:MAG TPA: sigma factor [Planctomycetota bacterium]|nr:sigma factor [Planctomycetota bacterium]
MSDFPDTRWSRLLELRDRSSPRYAEQLEGLARSYWTPAYHYIRALRPHAEAEDLAQQFFAMLLDRRDLEKLSPERGSFRGFLKTALRHFVLSAERARRPAGRTFPFDEAEAVFMKTGQGLSPDVAFDREWARGVMAEAVARLRSEVGPERFSLFQDVALGDASYEAAARARGWSVDDVGNRLREMRARLRELLRERLRDYLEPGQDVEAELRFILGP